MNGPRKTHEMFRNGHCRLCNHAVRGTANRNRHLDKHVRANELEEGGDRGFRWYFKDAGPALVKRDDLSESERKPDA